METTVKNESGQAIIEYLLTLVIGVSIVGILAMGIRRPISRVWAKLAREVAAPCPTCPADAARIRF